MSQNTLNGKREPSVAIFLHPDEHLNASDRETAPTKDASELLAHFRAIRERVKDFRDIPSLIKEGRKY